VTARTWLGVALLAAGLSGHLFAAHAIAWNPRAYPDHIFGFVFLTAVSGVILVALGRRFWPGRHDITVLILGGLQAIAGLVIYINRFRV
jgi:hypothetical protein